MISHISKNFGTKWNRLKWEMYMCSSGRGDIQIRARRWRLAQSSQVKGSCCWNKTCPAAERLSGKLRLFQWENSSCVFSNLPAYCKIVEQLVPYHKSKEKLSLSESRVYCWCLRGTIFYYSSSQMCWIYLRTALGLLSVRKKQQL